MNGATGHYHFVKYVVQRNSKDAFDVAMAVHHAQWNFGQTSDAESVARELHDHAAINAGVAYEELPEEAKRSLMETATSFVASNKKTEVTPDEMERWVDYFHARAGKQFGRNCLEPLLPTKD